MHTPDLAARLKAFIDAIPCQQSTPLLIIEALTQATIHAANKNPPHFAILHLDAAAAVLSETAKTIRDLPPCQTS
jgi:hypothetical protein